MREFAEHLGVSDRMVSKWEARREQIRPRPVNQAALDTSLQLADVGVRLRFRQLIARAEAERLAAYPVDQAATRAIQRMGAG